MWRRGRPAAIKALQELVNRLTRNIAMDQRLRQPLGKIGWPTQPGKPGRERERERLRGAGSEGYPPGMTSEFVTRPFDEKPVRVQPCRHRRPRLRDVGFVVLAQDVEGAHDQRLPAVDRQLETPAPKGEGVIGILHGCRYSNGIDLDPYHRDIGSDAAQTIAQIAWGPGSRTVAEVDHKRIGRTAEPGTCRVGDPTIDTSKPIRVRGSAGDRPDGAGRARHQREPREASITRRRTSTR